MVCFQALTRVVYLSIAIVGVTQVNEGLNPSNLVMDEHPFKKYFKIMHDAFLGQG